MNKLILSNIDKHKFQENIKYFYYALALIISIYMAITSIYSMSFISSSRNEILIESHKIVNMINQSSNNEFITKEYIDDKILQLENLTIYNKWSSIRKFR